MGLQRAVSVAAIGLVLLGAATLVLERGTAVTHTPRPVRLSPQAQAEIRQVEARINQIEADSVKRARGSSLDALGELTLLGKLMEQALAGVELPQSLVAIPVPLFKRKRRSRGFNQAEEIARAFVRHSRATGIELDTASLVRVRETTSQTGLTRHQRRANVRGAFAVTRSERIRGRSVLVVDDVMTTGTTAGECARVLKRVGARQVFVATVARATREVEIHLEEPNAWAQTAHA